VSAFAGDFGYDLDEEGQPMRDEEPPPLATPSRPLEQESTGPEGEETDRSTAAAEAAAA
jgi:hypothetical protein